MTNDAALAPGSCITLPPEGQRSQTYLPYFNLQWHRGGIVGAIGWTGQWELSVRRIAGRGVVLQAGQQRTHLKLHPGESIRTPRILLVHWQGADRMRGHNLLRRLLLAHYVPRINGQVVMPLLTQNTFWLFGDGNQTTERNQIETIAGIPAMGLEGYWMDAGWFEGGWPSGTGNWFPKKDHFPHGLRVVGDAAHKAGLKFVLWFEPERVDKGSRIAREHPRWLLAHQMFNLGDPQGAAMDDRLALPLHLRLGNRRLPAGPELLSSPHLAAERSAEPAGHHGDSPRRRAVCDVGRVAQAPPGLDDRQRQLASHGPGPRNGDAFRRVLDLQRGRRSRHKPGL